MTKYYVHAAKFFMPDMVKNEGYLAVEEGKFGQYQTEKPDDGEIVDYGKHWIAPGLVDTHIHGLKGYDVMDNDLEGLKTISQGLLECGVTSFLPTTLTADHELLDAVAQTVGEHYQEVKGAKIEGLYFEGPFFTEEHKGAQNPKYFSDPSIEVFNQWQKSAKGLIKKIALAPERAEVVDFIKAVHKQGVVVALGHSEATYEQAEAAVEAGASVFVHTYNGMSGLSHHAPGMVGAALTLADVYDELICDGHHVLPPAVQVVLKTRGYDHTALITDCMRAGAMPDGNYQLGEFTAVVANGAARLENGSLAGSVLKLIGGVKNVVDWNLATPQLAIKMATEVPAKSCHIDETCGSIIAERAADYIVLDSSLNLVATYLDGEKRYEATK